MVINNSPNVSNFDFTVQLDISVPTAVVKLTDDSTYIGAGQANIIGICFTAVSPRNTTFHQTVYPPDIDISGGGTISINLPIQGTGAMIGIYKFYATLIDQDGTQYVWTENGLDYKAINLCKPNAIEGAKGNYGGLALDVNFDCDAGILYVNNLTSFSYKGIFPSTTVVSIVVTYPADSTGTIQTQVAPFLPFTLPFTASGTYSISGQVTQTYQITDTTSVKAGYIYSQSFDVQCGYTLCKALCDYEKLYAEVQGCQNKTTADYQTQLRQLVLIQGLIIKVLGFKNCGKKFGNILEQIRAIGNFDCNCDCAPQGVAPSPIFFGGTIVKGNMCGDIDMVLTQLGSNVKIDLSDVTYNMLAGTIPSTEQQFLEISSEEGDCLKTFTFTIDPTKLIAAAVADAEVIPETYHNLTAASGWTVSVRLQYKKDIFGNVNVRGIVAGTSSAGTNTLTLALPAGYRPSANESFVTWYAAVAAQASAVQITVLTTGVITAFFTGINSNIGIGVNFTFNTA